MVAAMDRSEGFRCGPLLFLLCGIEYLTRREACRAPYRDYVRVLAGGLDFTRAAARAYRSVNKTSLSPGAQAATCRSKPTMHRVNVRTPGDQAATCWVNVRIVVCCGMSRDFSRTKICRSTFVTET